VIVIKAVFPGAGRLPAGPAARVLLWKRRIERGESPECMELDKNRLK